MAWLAALSGLLVCGAALGGCDVYDPGRVQHAMQVDYASAAVAGQPGTEASGAVDCPDDRTCEAANGTAVCMAGACMLASCQPSFADCDGRADNGCEVSLASPEHCGMCRVACKFSHAAASCKQGQCSVGSCDAGYGDCDGDRANGCERALSSASDCGACGHACVGAAHATGVCEQGACMQRCEAGYADCNGKPEDGCEQALNDSQHCGGCDVRCAGAQVEAAECQRGECVVTRCAQGSADCNRDASDGCEVDLVRAGSCGACNVACDLPHVASERCDGTGEAPSCQIDRSACGADDTSCLKAGKVGCEAGYADCDGKSDNGCETDLSQATSCGGCGVSCWADHKLTECHDQACVTVGCETGYGRCSDADECQSLQEDPNNCGECQHVCPADSPRCVGGKCSALMCARGTGDCDGDPQNACETNLNDPLHCGGCSVRCADLPHVRNVQCPSGRCQIGDCEPGYADCDKDAKNGCEVPLNTQADCGACGNSCLRPQAETTCVQGQCQLVSCGAGRANCNMDESDGCEVDLSSPDHCGSCGNACTGLPNVDTATCMSPDQCLIHCRSGFGDCDGQAANGCETNLTARTSCGSCTQDCSQLSHITASSCVEGQCTQLTCEPGYNDCDGDTINGCERPLGTTTDCGACGSACAPAHGHGDCSTGSCQLMGCDTGFDDCDGDPSNGCEASLTTPQHCGACASACPSGAPCTNGVCGCAQDSDCSGGRHCCAGACTDTEGRCSLLPCLGESRAQNRGNCGGCGMRCDAYCCGPLFN